MAQDIKRKPLSMKVDTGVSVSIVSESTCNKLWKRRGRTELRQVRVRLHTYPGRAPTVLGKLDVQVGYGEQVAITNSGT